MPDFLADSPEMQQYFNSLPAIVQETLTQSHMKIHSLEELKKCAENLTRGE